MYERDSVREWMRCRRGEVTCSDKDGTQQHQHRAAAKNKHCLKARVRQKEQETLLSPHCGYNWRMCDSSSENHLFSQSLLTSVWRIVGVGVLRHTVLHYVHLSSHENKWLRQACRFYTCSTLTYHKIQVILLVTNQLTEHQYLKQDTSACWSFLSFKQRGFVGHTYKHTAI